MIMKVQDHGWLIPYHLFNILRTAIMNCNESQ